MSAPSPKRIAWNNDKKLRQRFSFVCNATKGGLSSTEESGVLFCSQCQEKVYEVDTEEDFEFHARNQNCVVVQTQKNISLTAKANLKKEIYLTLNKDLGGTRFGPYKWDCEKYISIGANPQINHIYIPKVFGIPEILMRIEFIEDSICLRMDDEGEVEILAAGLEQRKPVKHTAILSDMDQIFIKGTDTWIRFTLSVEDSPPPIIGSINKPGGKLVVDSAPKRFFSYLKRMFTKN